MKWNEEQDLGPQDHQAFRITLKSGKPFVVDLTSAQYGYYGPVVPWFEYLRDRILVDGRLRVLKYDDTEMRIQPERAVFYVFWYQIAVDVRARAKDSLHESVNGGNPELAPLSTFFNQPTASFEVQRDSILSDMQDCIKSSLERLREDTKSALDPDL